MADCSNCKGDTQACVPFFAHENVLMLFVDSGGRSQHNHEADAGADESRPRWHRV